MIAAVLRALVFDFNGVLVDDEPIHLRMFQRALEPEGIALREDAYYERFLGFDDRGCFAAVLEEAGERADPARVMRLIARWYDVSVVYNAPVNAHFRGVIPRNVPLSQVLKMLEMTGEVHFTVTEKRIIVSP